jgi:hypothetical protein
VCGRAWRHQWVEIERLCDASTFYLLLLSIHIKSRSRFGIKSPTAIIALGPCTNLGVALKASPSLADDAAAVIVMGGAAERRGNKTPTAEANFHK